MGSHLHSDSRCFRGCKKKFHGENGAVTDQCSPLLSSFLWVKSKIDINRSLCSRYTICKNGKKILRVSSALYLTCSLGSRRPCIHLLESFRNHERKRSQYDLDTKCNKCVSLFSYTSTYRVEQTGRMTNCNKKTDLALVFELASRKKEPRIAGRNRDFQWQEQWRVP